MVKKQQKTAGPKRAQGRRKDAAADARPAADTPFAEQVKASAQQIWSAGLAAFAKAQDQGGVVADTLAKEGAKLQASARAAEATIDSAARRMGDMAGEVGTRAGQHWDKLESIFEDRVARALARLGMPSADEVAQLQARVEALSAEVAMLRAAKAPATGAKPAPTVKKSAAKKSAVKKAAPAAKRPAAKKATATKPAAKKAKRAA